MISSDFTNWHTATASGANGGGCVTVGYSPTLIGIGDTTLGDDSPIVVASHDTFKAFADAVQAGQLD